MKFVAFYHSLISDWNHDDAPFLRGVVSELLARGHEVDVFEPANAWSAVNLVCDHGEAAIAAFHAAYPGLRSKRYGLVLDLERALDGADVVVVHEWNDPALVARIGSHRGAGGRYALLFHDTHHRPVTARREIARHELRHYDGVLALGRELRDRYRERGWGTRAWTWHRAADTRVFGPHPGIARDSDLAWIGSWGDGADHQRAAELDAMLIEPARALGLRAEVHGTGYTAAARRALAAAGFRYGGWLASFDVPAVFARHTVTVHLPSRRDVEALPGIPAMLMFEALACGIPVISAPWHDDEALFTAGKDYLIACDAEQMRRSLRAVLHDRMLATELARRGRETILARHTCAHRVDELLAIVAKLGAARTGKNRAQATMGSGSRGQAALGSQGAPSLPG